MSSPTTLAQWLDHCERLHAQSVDFTLDRVRLARDQLGLSLTTTVISVAGTNGKGSACAMLEAIALQAGYRVGVHTSPHLVRFEERCRVDGENVQAEALLPHFEAVEQARGDVSLTYFEFTLLAIVRLFASLPLDLVVLEVGLGGRLDAVNVFNADCAIITSIDIDHTQFLGDTREAIGFEKAGIMRSGRPVVISDPAPPQSVIDHAAKIGADTWRLGRDFNYSGDRQQWSWLGRKLRYHALAYPALRGANQLANASGALAAFEALRERLPVAAQAVRSGFARVELPARFQIVPGRPVLVLDVAHNPHAVAALAHNLEQQGFYPRTHAVFGALQDKRIREMLWHMLRLVDHWYFTDLPTLRAASALSLADIHVSLVQTGHEEFATRPRVGIHATPPQALQAALAASDPADRIVVFGSFYTVGSVMQDGLPRTG